MIQDNDDCPACGSSTIDRQKYIAREDMSELDTAFKVCPHCDSPKCVMCDMGDDVECLSCDVRTD